MNRAWAWIKSWFVRKPKFTELEIDDDDREMQKEFFPGYPHAMNRVMDLPSGHCGDEPHVQVH